MSDSLAWNESCEPELKRVAAWICELCLGNSGGECHVPGCLFWLNEQPASLREMVEDFDEATAAAGLLAAPAPGVSHEKMVDSARLAYEAWVDDNGRIPEDWASYLTRMPDGAVRWRKVARAVLERAGASTSAALAGDEATPTMRTLHVTTTRDIPEGHTDQRVRYEWEGDSWEAWFIAFGKGENGQEAYLMRDNGERWVVMADNVTEIDSAAALAALREGQQ